MICGFFKKFYFILREMFISTNLLDDIMFILYKKTNILIFIY